MVTCLPAIGGLSVDYFPRLRLSFFCIVISSFLFCVLSRLELAASKPSFYILPEICSFNVPPHFTSPSAPHCTEKWLAVFDFAMWVGHACFGSVAKCKSMRLLIQKETNWIYSARLNMALNICENCFEKKIYIKRFIYFDGCDSSTADPVGGFSNKILCFSRRWLNRIAASYHMS